MTASPGARPGIAPAVRIDRVRVPFRRPFATSAGVWADRESWIVRVAGPHGMGAAEVPVGEQEPQPAGLEMALVHPRLAPAIADAAAAAAAEPPDALETGVNATLEAATPEALVADARAAVARGFRTLKVKAGGEATTGELASRVLALREAIGPGIRLRLDANGAWDRQTAVERLAAVAPLGIELVEQPVAPGDPADLAFVRARAGVPVAADEALTSIAAAEALLLAAAVDALVVKPSRVGGLAAARRIGELALSAGVPVVLSTLFETGVGLGGALGVASALAGITPSGVPALDHGLATADLLVDDLLAEPIEVDGGRARLRALIPDEAAIARFAVAEPLSRGWGA